MPIPEGRHRSLDFRFAVGLCVLVLLAYSNSLHDGLVIDSRILILKDPRIREVTVENLRLILTREYWWPTGATGVYRPLATLSYLVNYSVLGGGDSPVGYHVFNIALQGLNSVLAYFLLVRLLRDRVAAFLGAALFAVHPLATEAVTNVIGRTDQLVATSLLGALLCYARSHDAPSRSRRWLIAMSACAAVGLFSKETAVIIAPAILLYDLTFQRDRLRQAWRPLLALAPVYLMFWLSRSWVLSGAHPAQFPFGDNPLVAADFWTSRLTALKVLGRYLWLMLWPARLSCDYSYDQIAVLRWDWATGAALFALACLGVLGVHSWRRSKPMFFFLLLGLGALVPTSNLLLTIQSIMGERFAYTSLIGLGACLAIGARSWAPKVAPVVLVVAILACGVRTFVRNADWQNELSIWGSAVNVSPRSAKAQKAYASAMHASDPSRQNLEQVIARVNQAREILEAKPLPLERQDYATYADLGFYHLEAAERLPDSPSGQPERTHHYRLATEALEHAAAVQGAVLAALAGASTARSGTERHIEGIGDPNVDANLGMASLRLGEFETSLRAYSRLQRLSPEDWRSYHGSALALMGLGRTGEAGIAMLEALLVSKWEQGVLRDAIRLYAARYPGTDVLRTTGSQVNLNPGSPLVRRDLCEAYRRLSRVFREAGQADVADQIGAASMKGGCPR